MKSLHRNRRRIYVCSLSYSNGLRKYGEPVELMENWSYSKTSAMLEKQGLDSRAYVTIATDKSHAKYYKVGDRVYLNVTPPTTTDVLCKNADFEVSAPPIITLNECSVELRGLSGKN